MKIEVIGGSKEWQDAIIKKAAVELDPKGILKKRKPRKRKDKNER